MLDAKLEGKEISVPEPAEPAQVIDLMEALKESVSQAQKAKSAATKAKKEPARKKRAASVPAPASPWAAPGPGRQVRLEEGLVDLALVDRNGLLIAHTDDLVALDPQLLRALRASGGWARSSLLRLRAQKSPPAGLGRARCAPPIFR